PTFSHQAPRPPRYLHSFPTRRSSDLALRRPGGGRRDAAARRRRQQGLLGRTDWSASAKQPSTCSACRRRSVKAVPVRSCVAASKDRKSTRLNSSHVAISYAVFCLKKK